MCCLLCLCRFLGFVGVSATPTPQICWYKTTSARFRLLCHPLCTKSNKHMLTPACAFVNAEKAHLRRSPCEYYGVHSTSVPNMADDNSMYTSIPLLEGFTRDNLWANFLDCD